MSQAKIRALHAQFQKAGYLYYYLPDIHPMDDNAVGLVETEDGWQIAYWERGRPNDPVYYQNFDSASDALIDRISASEHWHCVGFSRDLSCIQVLEADLSAKDINFHRNDIPNYAHKGDRVYRVFVVNVAIHSVHDAFGTRMPVHDRIK